MVFIWTLLLTLGLMTVSADRAEAQSFCNQTPPVIRIQPAIQPVSLNHGLTKKQIRKLASGIAGGDRHAVVGGVYRPLHSYELKTSAYDNRLGNQRCITAKEVVLNYRVVREVYIPREYPRRSCQFSAVYNHEMQHVHFDEQAIDKYLPRFERVLAKAVIGKSWTRPEQLYSGLDRMIKQEWDRFNRERDRLHRTIDNAKNYARESKVCSKW